MKKVKVLFVLATQAIRHLVAVLDFPSRIDNFILYAKGIHDTMSNNATYSGSTAKLLTLKNHTQTLEDEETGMHTTPPTSTKADRDAALSTVQNDLRALRADVQALADATPASAQAIIENAGMKVKTQGAINKQDFLVKNGEVSGSVELVAKGIENSHSAHDWAMSIDGNNWTALTPTLAAHTTVSGLTKGAILDFRHRDILKDGPGDWSDPIEWVIQ